MFILKLQTIEGLRGGTEAIADTKKQRITPQMVKKKS